MAELQSVDDGTLVAFNIGSAYIEDRIVERDPHGVPTFEVVGKLYQMGPYSEVSCLS